MKSKVELATTRIKRLLELLSSYSFNLYYIKGKDMVLSDFLFRQKTDDSNPHEIIPISFSLRRVLHENYYKLDKKTEEDKYVVQTGSQAKPSGVKVPELHGIEKTLVPHVKPERQESVVTLPIDKRLPTDIRLPIPKLTLGQGRAGIRRKARVILPTPMPRQMLAPKAVQSLPEPVVQSQERSQPQYQLPAQTPISQPTGHTCITQPIGPRIEHRSVSPCPDPFLRPPPRPLDVIDLKYTRKDLLDLDTDRNIDFEEN